MDKKVAVFAAGGKENIYEAADWEHECLPDHGKEKNQWFKFGGVHSET